MRFKKLFEDINDGWEIEPEDCDLLDTLDDCARLAYEVKNCIRGAYTKCTTYQGLGNYVIDIANSLKYCGEQLLNMEEPVEEKLTGSEIDDFFTKARKLGVKNLKDLQRLKQEPEFGEEEKTDIAKMHKYYGAANPEDIDLSKEN